VAYACSFRITEAVYFVERLVDCLAFELKMDPAELRLRNLLKPEQFPYKSKTGWVYDSGEYEKTMRLAMEMIGYDGLRAEQREKRARGELMGIGMSFFTEAVGAGPRKDMDILGLGMADGCELRVHPTGKAVVRLSVQTQGPDPVRSGHLRQPVHPGVGGCGRARRPQGAGQGQDHRLGHAGSLCRRPRVGQGQLPRQG
jgi:carbon-monoxide dehydrogenase large subunit